MRARDVGPSFLGLAGIGSLCLLTACSAHDDSGDNHDCGTTSTGTDSTTSSSTSSSTSSTTSSTSSTSSTTSSSSSTSSSSETGCSSGTANDCYSGPPGTAGKGICKAGKQTCSDGVWGACQGEVVPQAEVCGDGLDNDCDGAADVECSPPPMKCKGAGNIWHFGSYAGIDFNGPAPVSITGPIATEEGTATISDCDGNILVTSDGSTAYDRNGAPMPNGTSLGGGNSSLQSALLLAEPGSNNQVVHLFSVTPAEWGLGPLHHSRIDMTQNGGLGDVDPLQKAQDLSPSVPITEKLIGVKHANGVDDWIIVHAWMSDMFQAYRLSSGQIAAPVESHTGAMSDDAYDYYGALAASKDGKRLVTHYGGSNIFEIYDFDNATGVVSLKATVPKICTGYGAELSPGGNVLYMTCYPGAMVYQYDLSSMDPNAIAASALELCYGAGQNGQVKRGPDGRVYFGSYNTSYIGIITNPDVLGAGAACDPTGLPLLTGTYVMEGLPNTPPGLY